MDQFNAFITPDGKLLRFGSPHDVYAKTRLHSKVPELLRDGYVRVSWYVFKDVHPLVDAYDLRAVLPAIQLALLPIYEREGNLPITAYEQVKRSSKKNDHIIDTDLATLTLGTFRDIRDGIPFGERENPGGDDFIGWVSPKGEKFPLWKDTHETLADKLLVRFYDEWPEKSPIKGRRWTKSDALKMGGWIRASGSNYSVHKFGDSMGRIQTNLVDLIAELPDDEKIFVDDWIDGDLICNKTAGWFLDKYQ